MGEELGYKLQISYLRATGLFYSPYLDFSRAARWYFRAKNLPLVRAHKCQRSSLINVRRAHLIQRQWVCSQGKMAERMANESCDLVLNLQSSGDSERGHLFWNTSSVEMKFSVERKWIKAVRKAKRKPNFGMLNMDSQMEGLF